jgi:hypothetical protein
MLVLILSLYCLVSRREMGNWFFFALGAAQGLELVVYAMIFDLLMH